MLSVAILAQVGYSACAMPIKRSVEWQPDDDPFEEPSDSDDDDWADDVDKLSPEECGERMSELLLSMLYSGSKVTAVKLCIIAYWAQRAGAVGVEALAFAPGKQTGQYQKHLDSKLGTRPRDLDTYKLELPRYLKTELCRSVVEEDVLMPQQARPMK